jgi:hypothetical protein
MHVRLGMNQKFTFDYLWNDYAPSNNHLVFKLSVSSLLFWHSIFYTLAAVHVKVKKMVIITSRKMIYDNIKKFFMVPANNFNHYRK